MRRRPVVYSPYADARYFWLAIALTVTIGILALGLMTTAFTRIGFSLYGAILVLVLSLAGSSVNIGLFKMRSEVPITEIGLVRYGPFLYRVPVRLTEVHETLIAVNVGGALIPIFVSVYLLANSEDAVLLAFAATAIVAAVIHRLAVPVRDLGVVVGGFWPPLVTAVTVIALASLLGSPQDARVVAAYVGGTLGTLIGADLLNLRAISRLGAGICSIGGAGTFDGIFLAGIVAVLLT